MIIEAAPPAEIRLREDTRKANYVYAPEPGSFYALLREMTNIPVAEQENQDAPEEMAVTESGENASETESSTTEISDESTELAPAPTAVTADTDLEDNAAPTSGETVEETPPIVNTTTDAALPPTGTPLNPATDTGTVEAPVVQAPVTQATVVAPRVAPTKTSEEIAPTPELTEEALVAEVVAQPSGTESEEATTEDDSAPRNSFPKTLNAHLAEKALRPVMTDASPEPMLKAQEHAETPVVDDSPLPDDSIPDTMPPTPQSTATELGGVRTASQTPAPRIPLTNLPGEIAQQIHLIQQQGTSTIRLRLSPENLGEIRLEIERKGNTVRVTMISKNPHVRDALDGQLDELRNALDKQGFSLDEASVEDSSYQNRDDRPFSWDTPDTLGSPSEDDPPPINLPKSHSPAHHAAENGLNILA